MAVLARQSRASAARRGSETRGPSITVAGRIRLAMELAIETGSDRSELRRLFLDEFLDQVPTGSARTESSPAIARWLSAHRRRSHTRFNRSVSVDTFSQLKIDCMKTELKAAIWQLGSAIDARRP